MRRAIVVVTPDFVFEWLGLPSGAVLVEQAYDPERRVFLLAVEHPELPEGVREAEPRYESDGNGGAEFVDWGLKGQ